MNALYKTGNRTIDLDRIVQVIDAEKSSYVDFGADTDGSESGFWTEDKDALLAAWAARKNFLDMLRQPHWVSIPPIPSAPPVVNIPQFTTCGPDGIYPNEK